MSTGTKICQYFNKTLIFFWPLFDLEGKVPAVNQNKGEHFELYFNFNEILLRNQRQLIFFIICQVTFDNV